MNISKASSTKPDLFGHPKGLTILAATEMWEVFSFLGMKTLLIYYMTQDLLFSSQKSSLIYGTYTGLVYLFPIFGAIACDRWLGRRKSVISGGLIMAAGHFMLTFESMFFPALLTVALGAGLFLPSLPSQIKNLYENEDPRRKWAHSAYYLGMNVGAFLAPLVCGTLGELYGWHWGFGVAGIGMLVGISIYIRGSRYLPDEPAKRISMTLLAKHDREVVVRRFFLVLCVAAILVLFRASYEQIGNSLALWLDGGVDRRIYGWQIPMTWFQALNPLFVFVFTPLLLWRWARAAAHGRETAAARKMAFGSALLALSYLGLAIVASVSSQPHWIWFLLFVSGLTLAELCVLPICLGLFNRIAPDGFASMGAAIWFLTASGGNFLGGILGTLWQNANPAKFMMIMSSVAAIASLIMLLIERFVNAADRPSDAITPTSELSVAQAG